MDSILGDGGRCRAALASSGLRDGEGGLEAQNSVLGGSEVISVMPVAQCGPGPACYQYPAQTQ